MRTARFFFSAALAIASAQAAVVYTDHLPDLFLTGTSPSALSVFSTTGSYDIDNDGNGDFLIDLVGGDYVPAVDTLFARASVIPTAEVVVLDGTDAVALLAPGTMIGPTLDAGLAFGTGVFDDPYFGAYLIDALGGAVTGEWSNNLLDPGIFGLSLTIAGQTHYGWVRIGVVQNASSQAHPALVTGSAIVYDWAYEDTPNTAILAGDVGVPEPSSIALMAFGLSGLAIWKRRTRA